MSRSLLFLTWSKADVIRRMMVIKAVDLAGIKPKLVETDNGIAIAWTKGNLCTGD